jgi:hypothetical protein
MRLIILALLLIVIFGCSTVQKQMKIPNDNLYEVALTQYKNNEFEKAELNFDEFLQQKTNKDLQYYSVLYYLGEINRLKGNLKKSNNYFIDVIENSEEMPFHAFILQSIIQNYYALSDYNNAEKYKKIIKSMYKRKILPEQLNYYFWIDTFSVGDKIIYSEEAFADLGSPESEGSFSKLILYVNNEENQELFRFETVKIHTTDTNPRYLLNQRWYDDGMISRSNSFWQYRFNDPIDYLRLKKIVINLISPNQEQEKEDTINLCRWLINNPLDENFIVKYGDVFGYQLKYDFDKESIFDDFFNESLDESYGGKTKLIQIYHTSKTLYLLQNERTNDSELNSLVFAVNNVLDLYKLLSKKSNQASEFIERLIIEQNNSNLEKYISDKIY